MSLVALITDTHFGARSDNPLFYSYFDRFLNEIFFPTLKKKRIKKIIHLGDVNDRRKYMNYQTLAWADTFFNRTLNAGLEVDIIAGNHDTYFKSTNSVNSPDLLYSKYKNVNIYSEPIDKDGILYVPWINSENHQKTLDTINKSESPVVMGHLELTGFTMFKGSICSDGTNPDIFHKFNSVYTGHFHTKSSSRNIHYLGSPWDLMFTDAEDQKGFHIWDSETDSLLFVENPFKMYWKLYYEDTGVDEVENLLFSDNFYSKIKDTYVKVYVKGKTNPLFFDRYIQKINESSPYSLSIVEDYVNQTNGKEEEAISITEDTLSVLIGAISSYSDIIGTEDKKEKVQKLLSDLYVEALKI